jgi:hypothetical protein
MSNILSEKILSIYDLEKDVYLLDEGKLSDGIRKAGAGVALGAMAVFGGLSASQAGVSAGHQSQANQISQVVKSNQEKASQNHTRMSAALKFYQQEHDDPRYEA